MGVDAFFPKSHHLKPREKARNLGIEALEDYELLALLLETGTRHEDVLELSQRYLKEKGGLSGIFLKNEGSLVSYGVKDAKVYRLLAVKEMLRRLPYCKSDAIVDAKDLFEKTHGEFSNPLEEKLLVLFLDIRKNIIALSRFTSLQRSSVRFSLEAVVERAYGCRASFVALVHNHPSGVSQPSNQDIETCRALSNKLQLLNILLLDALIVTEDSYYSFRENNILPLD